MSIKLQIGRTYINKSGRIRDIVDKRQGLYVDDMGATYKSNGDYVSWVRGGMVVKDSPHRLWARLVDFEVPDLTAALGEHKQRW